MDALESYRKGHQEGQELVVKLINRFGGFDAKSVTELIQLICKAKEYSDE